MQKLNVEIIKSRKYSEYSTLLTVIKYHLVQLILDILYFTFFPNIKFMVCKKIKVTSSFFNSTFQLFHYFTVQADVEAK